MIAFTIDASRAAAFLAGTAAERLRAAGRAMLPRALDAVASRVQRIGHERRLIRSGTLLSSIVPVTAETTESGGSGWVGVPDESPASSYAYLLGGESRTIRPTRGAALTIPTKENLTGAGVPRWPTVAALRAQFGDSVVAIGRAIGILVGARTAKFVPYFVLVRSVTVRGRDVLRPAADEARGDIAEIARDEIVRALEQAGGDA